MKNNCVKITIIGNSVAIRVRPPKTYPDNLNYTQWLEKKLHESYPKIYFDVRSLAKGGETVNEMLGRLDNYITAFPDIYVLNIGVVDASTREIPKWFFNIINSKKEGCIRNSFKLIYNGLIKKSRRQLVKLFGKRTWISKRKFRKAYSSMVYNLTKETNAKIILMSINSGNERIENEAPGSTENYKKYNKIIREIAEEYGADFISFDMLVSEKHFPDGIHYSYEGHKLIADELVKHIDRIITKAGY